MGCINCGKKKNAQSEELCKQKLEKAKTEAKAHAVETQKTQAVYKQGCQFFYCDATDIGDKDVVEYISAY